jgi:ABC-type sugar transport system substrate-binding protein
MKAALLTSLLLTVAANAATAKAATSPTIVFVGDQVTANWPLTQTSPNWINQGQVGAFSATVAASFQTAINLHPNIIHILVGLVDQEHDIGDAVPAEITPAELTALQTMVQEARAANIQVILGLEPSGPPAFGYDCLSPSGVPCLSPTNSVVAAYGAQQGIPVISYQNVETQTTGVPDAAGYQQMTTLLESVLATMNLKLGGGYLQNTTAGLGAAPLTNQNTVSTGIFVQFTPVGWYNDGSIHSQINTNLQGATGTWTSSNPLVITIDQTGYGQALTAGTTIIRYTTPNGVAFSEWIMYVFDGA